MDEDLQTEQALLFMDAWGDGSKLVSSPFHGFKYAIEGYYPEYSSQLVGDYFQSNDDLVMTVLANTLATRTPDHIEGYRVVHAFQAGERDCPGCQFDKHGADCPICRGDNFVYWGEEWRVYVLVPILTPEIYEDEDGTIEYKLDGSVLHRDDGPARILPGGREEWFQLGYLHRENGPAILDKSEQGKVLESYYLESTHHNGPDYIDALLGEYPRPIPTWTEAQRIVLEKDMQGELREDFERAVYDRVSQPRPTMWDHLDEVS